eukprot:353800_1
MSAPVNIVHPSILKHEYLHILNTMNPCGQSYIEIIDRYVEEATRYERNTSLGVVHGNGNGKNLRYIENQVIEILDGILNDGAVPLDVAFCRLIIILPYVQFRSRYACEFIGFFIYFIVGSCFPTLRQNIKLNRESHSYQRSKVLQYLMETYFAQLNDTRCIRFKYSGQKSTLAISTVLQQYVNTATEHGDAAVASIICDYVQYPHHEFVYFINNFLWHFQLHRHLKRCAWQFSNLVQFFVNDTTNGHLLPRLLSSECFCDHADERLTYEAHRMALMNLKTCEDLSRYFDRNINASIRCYMNPQ